jgi:hypothetical protein
MRDTVALAVGSTELFCSSTEAELRATKHPLSGFGRSIRKVAYHVFSGQVLPAGFENWPHSADAPQFDTQPVPQYVGPETHNESMEMQN